MPLKCGRNEKVIGIEISGLLMSKDSEMFLKKVLLYRNKMEKDSFALNIKHFLEILIINSGIGDI